MVFHIDEVKVRPHLTLDTDDSFLGLCECSRAKIYFHALGDLNTLLQDLDKGSVHRAEYLQVIGVSRFCTRWIRGIFLRFGGRRGGFFSSFRTQLTTAQSKARAPPKKVSGGLKKNWQPKVWVWARRSWWCTCTMHVPTGL